jgi:hypothetical protein
MSLQFKVYERTESTLVEIGTVGAQIPNGSLNFTPNSLNKFKAGQIKAISMLLTNRKGESLTMPLSKRVSATIKTALENGSTKTDCLKAISKLTIVEMEDGANIISAPQGSGGVEETITINASVTNSKVSYEDILESAAF